MRLKPPSARSAMAKMMIANRALFSTAPNFIPGIFSRRLCSFFFEMHDVEQVAFRAFGPDGFDAHAAREIFNGLVDQVRKVSARAVEQNKAIGIRRLSGLARKGEVHGRESIENPVIAHFDPLGRLDE